MSSYKMQRILEQSIFLEDDTYYETEKQPLGESCANKDVKNSPPKERKPYIRKNRPDVDRPFSCDQCGSSFTHRKYLKVHMRIHTGEKPYKCGECGRCFTVSRSVVNHMRTHTGEKPYQCLECGRCFIQISNLNEHMKRIHPGVSYSPREPKKEPVEIIKPEELVDNLEIYEHTEEIVTEVKNECEQIISNVTECEEIITSLNECEEINTSVNNYEEIITSVNENEEFIVLYEKDVIPEHEPIVEPLEVPEQVYYKVEEHDPTLDKKVQYYVQSGCVNPAPKKKVRKFDNSVVRERKPHISKQALLAQEGERPHICQVCGNSYRTKNHFNVHMRSHTGEKPYVCYECGRAFTVPRSLQNHMRIHTGERPYECGECGRCFIQLSNVKEHIRRIHQKNETDHSAASLTKNNPKKKSSQPSGLKLKKLGPGEKPFKCSECGKDFKRVAFLRKHMYSHENPNPFKCIECGVCFSQHCKLVLHARCHSSEKPYACSICGAGFRYPHHVKEHERIHSGDKIHKCGFCDAAFTHKSNLNAHVKLHSGEKPYKCELCNRCFTVPKSLRNHMMLHTGERPFKCSQCEKSFVQRGSLSEHIKNTHSESKKQISKEKKFKCPECEEWFRESREVIDHIKTHKGAKPFRCSVCDKGFDQYSNLNIHMKLHLGQSYTCNICDKSYATKNYLRIHLKLHNGERPYKCPMCDKTFSVPKCLTVHMRLHTGEKPFKCTHCDKRYAQSGGLTEHLKRAHKDINNLHQKPQIYINKKENPKLDHNITDEDNHDRDCNKDTHEEEEEDDDDDGSDFPSDNDLVDDSDAESVSKYIVTCIDDDSETNISDIEPVIQVTVTNVTDRITNVSDQSYC